MKKKETHASSLTIDKKICPRSKRSQEEIVGFALIIIIVAVILLIFLSFSLKKPQKEGIESYEVESFLISALQYTSECRDDENIPLSIQELIGFCNENKKCYENGLEKDSCEVSERVIREMVNESWKTGESHVKWYELDISSVDKKLVFLESGNKTRNYKSAGYEFIEKGKLVKVDFGVYY